MSCGCNKNKPCTGENCKRKEQGFIPPIRTMPKTTPNNISNISDNPNPTSTSHINSLYEVFKMNTEPNLSNPIPNSVSPKNLSETVPEIQTETEFRSREIENPDGMFKMAKSLVSALASRGIQNNKVSVELKQLRVLSCFGNKSSGGELPACEFLRKSKTEGKFFCGGCGCGDKPMTWLNATETEYSKLDYPKLNCPLQMPGFNNYTESSPEESVSPITRRYYIENMKFEEIQSVSVTTPEPPATPAPPEQPK